MTHRSISYYSYDNGKWQSQDGYAIQELPVSLTVNGSVWMTWMCTPVQLDALAVGFLYNEYLIDSLDEIADIRVCPALDNIDIWTKNTIQKPEQWRKTSGCTGGITSVHPEKSLQESIPAVVNNGFVITATAISDLIDELFRSQSLYRLSGGVHTSMLTDGKGNNIVSEDIGRHNTLDKLAGLMLMNQVHLEQRMIFTTGRISSEMLQKAARLQVGIVVSRTSPTSLSIELAKHAGITLLGYARRNSFRLYTHPEKILTIELPNLESVTSASCG